MHSDFSKIKRGMTKQYGKEKGEQVYHSWLNKHGYDDTKPLSEQKSKAGADASLLDLFEEEANDVPHPSDAPHEEMEKKMMGDASKKDGSPGFISISAFKTPYIATPKTTNSDGPIIIKAVVLEPGLNVNNWRVVDEEFGRVAEQYKAGRQLRLNHDKDVESVIGKSFEGKVMLGRDLAAYLGKEIEGILPDGNYVTAEFESNPADQQVRTNILHGYVETGSIGLDANAFCEVCDKPLVFKADSMERTCKHLDAPVKLRNVDVKEYSYVAEPAFEHTKAFPSFSAAVNSSLSKIESNTTMMADEKSVPKDSKVEAVAKAESEGEGVHKMAEAMAERLLAEYKKGFADAIKYRAADDEEKEKKMPKDAKVEATASAETKKTDQVGVVNPPATAKETPDWMSKMFNPTKSIDPAIKELFTAAAEGKDAPRDIKGYRWE